MIATLITLHHVRSRHILSHHVTNISFTSHYVTSHHIVMHCTSLHCRYRIASHSITSRHVTSNHITLHRIESSHVTSHRITSYDIKQPKYTTLYDLKYVTSIRVMGYQYYGSRQHTSALECRSTGVSHHHGRNQRVYHSKSTVPEIYKKNTR